jgi:hypothetical protein
VTVPSASNAGRSAARLSAVVPGRTPSSVSTIDRLALALGDRHRDDLVGEPAVLDRVGGTLVDWPRLVLLLAADLVLAA